MDSALSNILLVDECLLDAKRVNIFKDNINKIVKKGDIVVDSGTGTGIMAMLAAKAGAKKVFAVERDPDLAKFATKNIKAAKLDKIITVINKDVRKFALPKGVTADVLIMEMLDTGLIAELQAKALISLKKNKVIVDKTILIPERATMYVQGIDYDFNFYGFDLPLNVQARNFGTLDRVNKVLTTKSLYEDLDLKEIKSPKLNQIVEMAVRKEGIINALKLTTDVYMSGRKYGATTDMNMPVVVPIKPRKVKRGSKVKVSLNYVMSEGFSKLRIKLL